MARLLPPPVNQAEIVLSGEGVLLHPEIELVEAVADRVELGLESMSQVRSYRLSGMAGCSTSCN
ncbi:hypothetical protein EQ826_24225 [Ectopseudomonas mendocina]|nr:hypothetical protein [Pseudomonas mendocina]TRO19160.1 hypothetical protein EQ826_24225 [Pseudomonas mendocina]